MNEEANLRIGFIGFGEAAGAFVSAWRDVGLPSTISAYDILFDEAASREKKRADCIALDVTPVASAAEMVDGADVIIAAVTADQVLNAARSVAGLPAQACYLDINSAAPQKKQRAAAIIGDGYLDLAVLSPVFPARNQAPILAAGPRAAIMQKRLTQLFPAVEVVSEQVGDASMIKMLRSIFVKGIEAVATECAVAACKAGLAERVFPSLDVVLRHTEARALADYTMERVATHGIRRAAEMDEVCDTLMGLGVPDFMSRGAASLQRLVGNLRLQDHPDGVHSDAVRLSRQIIERLS